MLVPAMLASAHSAQHVHSLSPLRHPFGQQWSAEVNARITTTFFAWLVGPMDLEVHDVTFKGMDQQWKSKVHIKKCRYLEQSGCVGMCVNMCQQPTQSFFTDKVGLPLTMVRIAHRP